MDFLCLLALSDTDSLAGFRLESRSVPDEIWETVATVKVPCCFLMVDIQILVPELFYGNIQIWDTFGFTYFKIIVTAD